MLLVLTPSCASAGDEIRANTARKRKFLEVNIRERGMVVLGSSIIQQKRLNLQIRIVKTKLTPAGVLRGIRGFQATRIAK